MNNIYSIFTLIIIIILITKIIIELIIYKQIKYLYKLCKNKLNINKQEFLEYVCKNIEYYNKNNCLLNDFEYITKDIISKNNTKFINKNIKLIEASKKSANNSWTIKKEQSVEKIDYFTFINYIYNLLNGSAISHITGGSSGNYFYQWYTLDEYYKGLYGFIKCWINLGWTPKKKILVIYFHGANSIKILNKINNLYDNIHSYSPELNEKGDLTTKSVLKIVSLINEYKPYLLVSFPSIIFRLSELIYKNDIKLKYYPKAMDLSADFLFTCQYKFIKTIFINCDIRLSYGTIEFGQIAQQIPNTHFDYIVFDDIVNIENAPNTNLLVVTSYLFTTQPIIRYKTDDIGIVVNDNNKVIIKNLVGKNIHNNVNNLNYVKINRYINSLSHSNIIINFRLNIQNKIIFITISNLSEYVMKSNNIQIINNNIINYFINYYNDYKIKIIHCNKKKCNTIDRYNRKNTPIINEQVEKYKPSSSTSLNCV